MAPWIVITSMWVRLGIAVLCCQLMFSCIAATLVTIRQHRFRRSRLETAGAILWMGGFWLKSVLIVVAVIFGVKAWVMGFVIAAACIFAMGDVGMICLLTVSERHE